VDRVRVGRGRVRPAGPGGLEERPGPGPDELARVAQRAARDGDFKFLKILDNTFLFDVVVDPMERANLKERRKDVYERIVGEWLAWNASMLPEVAESFTEGFTGAQLPDHIGAQKATTAPDNPGPLPAAQAR